MKLPAFLLAVSISSLASRGRLAAMARAEPRRKLHRERPAQAVARERTEAACGFLKTPARATADSAVAAGQAFHASALATERKSSSRWTRIRRKGTLGLAPIGDILGNGWGDGPRSSPTVDADRVYALSGKGNLVCAQVADGKVLWTKSMQNLGGKTPNWGYAESPLVDGKLVLATPGGEKGTMAAFDKMTGASRHGRARTSPRARNIPPSFPATINGKKQYVQLVMQTLFGVDAATGKLIWRSPWSPGRTAVIPTPIVKGDEVFISSGYGAGCMKVKVNGSEAANVFMNKDLDNHHGGVILDGDYIYGHSNKGGWTCMSLGRRQREMDRQRACSARVPSAMRTACFTASVKRRGERRAHRGIAERLEREGPLQARSADDDPQPERRYLDASRSSPTASCTCAIRTIVYCYDVKTPTP